MSESSDPSAYVRGYHEAWCVTFTCAVALVCFAAFYIFLHVSIWSQSYDKKAKDSFFNSLGSIKALLLKPEVTSSDMKGMLEKLDILLAEPGYGANGRPLKRDVFTMEFTAVPLTYTQ